MSRPSHEMPANVSDVGLVHAAGLAEGTAGLTIPEVAWRFHWSIGRAKVAVESTLRSTTEVRRDAMDGAWYGVWVASEMVQKEMS